MNKNFLLGKLTPYRNNVNLIKNDQVTRDIIQQIIEAHNKYKSDYDKIANYFWKGNVKDTCKYLFSFLKNNVMYSVEPESRQSVKSPAAILATGNYKTGYNDCKHYSLFQAGVFDALNRQGKKIDWVYRFANYRLFNTTPHHVFVVVKINGVEYWCDPVLDSWNEKKPYINKIDKKMSLYSISGVGCCNMCAPKMRGSFGQPEIVGARSTRQSRRSGENCTGRKLAKYAPPLIAGRKAFLALVRLNVKRYALRLHKQLQSANRTALLEKWCALGGNAKVLEQTVNKAYDKYKRKHPAYIGEPLAVTLIATATPVIVALLKFLGKDQAADLAEGVQESAEQYSTNFPSGEGQTAGIGSINPIYYYAAGGLALLYYFTKKK